MWRVCACVSAEAVVQSLLTAEGENKVLSIVSTPGEGPGQDGAKWAALFGQIPASADTPASLLQKA